MTKTIKRVTAGHSWITGESAPKVDGWVCFFVAHFGIERTEWTYKRVKP